MSASSRNLKADEAREEPKKLSFVCVLHEILNGLVYAMSNQLYIDSLLPKEQAGFRGEKSTVDRAILLT